MSYRRSGSGCLYILLLIVVIIVSISTIVYRPINKVSNEREVIVTVTDKNVKNYKDDSKYLIFCKDDSGESCTYEITDSWLAGRFNSSDVYAGIEVGKKYKFEIRGSRNTLLSWYPNIYGYELVEE